ncbi:putative mucin/carbohydrate-binding domain-containing protein [Clostridium tarantellae]|uniref:Peptidase M60 domain-containing protein n=1 Tax=Clostridium tarantellae TaxID=39493 RepID=A0A6I1MKC1_9CLOT|nr:putative mucin/carbohydrate-binding domain-containing protein [Clostridium tarantellae]MPQ42622.1 hypothetical protein [Clostridium tarantellae]
MSENRFPFRVLSTSIDFEEVNIYRKTSLAPDSFVERKKFNLTLHSLEPLGIEVMHNTTVEIMVLGDNLKGYAALYVHNVDNVFMVLNNIPLNESTTVTVKDKGELFLEVRNIKYTLGEDVPFSFKVRVSVSDKSKYVITPTLDVRESKISTKVFNDEDQFKAAISVNGDNGMLMISDNVRVYFPKSKFVRKDLVFRQVIDLHEQTINKFNKLAGLKENAIERIDKPRRNFVLVSARHDCSALLTASSTMLDTKPLNSSFYVTPFWAMFHEYGHLFDQPWVLDEIWNNLYAINISKKTIGLTWLWESNRKTFESENILKFYETYFVNEVEISREFFSAEGLYFLFTLQDMFGIGFIESMTNYYTHNSTELKGVPYIVYVVAKIYKVNIIPYVELYGYTDLSEDLKGFVIENCTSSAIYIPKSSSFNKFRNVSITPTVVMKDGFSSKYIYGIGNKESVIKINIDGVDYTEKANLEGKFYFTIPVTIDESSIIEVNSIDTGKTLSPVKVVKSNVLLSQVSLVFKGSRNIDMNVISFDTISKFIKVKSGEGTKPNYIGDKVYFSFKLYDNEGNLICEGEVSSKSSVDNFVNIINGYKFNYGYYFKVSHLEQDRCILNGSIIGINLDSANSFKGIDLTSCRFYIKSEGIEYVPNTTFTFLGIGDLEIATLQVDYESKELVAKSTSYTANYKFKEKTYFQVALYDVFNNLKIMKKVIGSGNGDEFARDLNGFKFDIGDYLVITHGEKSKLLLTGNVLNKPSNFEKDFEDINLGSINFVFTKGGLKFRKEVFM